MLTALCRSVPPRWDVLEAIRDRRIAPLHALGLWRMGRLAEVPDVSVLPQVQATYDAWVKDLKISPEYRQALRSTFTRLLALKPEATLADLPQLLRQYRETCKENDAVVMFMRSKAMLQGFVRDVLGRQHSLYTQLTSIATLGAGERSQGRAQKPKDLALLLDKLPEPHRSMAWSMAVTGMGPKEYWGEWWRERDPLRLHIEGTKRKARIRDVPLWCFLPVVPTRTRGRFASEWTLALKGVLNIYDLRRSFSVWLEDAGIPRSRQRIYMGHEVGDVTELYQRRDLLAWLEEDSELLRAYAGKVIEDGFGLGATLAQVS